MSTRMATILAALSLSALPARATDGLPVSFLADVRRADTLVIGTVETTRAEWTGRWVETEATIATDDGPVLVRTIGGEVDGLGTFVADAARFERGRRVAVLAVQTESGWAPASGERSVVRLDEVDGPTAGEVLSTVEWIRRERWDSSRSGR